MKSRPWAIITLGVLHILYPIYSLLIIDIVFSGTPAFLFSEFYDGWRTIEFFILIPLGGLAILAMKPWSYPVVLIAWGVNFVSSISGFGDVPNTNMIPLSALQNLLGVVIVMYFLIPNVRAVYYNPRVRWWEHKPRFYFDSPCRVIVDNGGYDARILDISQSGIFITSQIDAKLSTKITILIEQGGVSYNLKGTIVHRRKEAATGYGIRFSRLDSETKIWLINCIAVLENEGKINQARIPNVRTFIQWLKSLLTTGKGLIPDSDN